MNHTAAKKVVANLQRRKTFSKALHFSQIHSGWNMGNGTSPPSALPSPHTHTTERKEPWYAATHLTVSNLKISVADPDPGSGAFLTPGSGMGIKSGSGYGMNKPDHNSESLETMRIRDGKNPDPG
jgi:hypothetical protein